MRLLIVNLVPLQMSVRVQHLFHCYRETVVKELPKLSVLVLTWLLLLLILWVNGLNKLWYDISHTNTGPLSIAYIFMKHLTQQSQFKCLVYEANLYDQLEHEWNLSEEIFSPYTKLQIAWITFGMTGSALVNVTTPLKSQWNGSSIRSFILYCCDLHSFCSVTNYWKWKQEILSALSTGCWFGFEMWALHSTRAEECMHAGSFTISKTVRLKTF